MYDVVGDVLAREAAVLEFIWGKREEGCSGTGQSSGSVLHSDPACSSCAGPPFWNTYDLHFEEMELNPPAVLYSHTLYASKKKKYSSVQLTARFVMLLPKRSHRLVYIFTNGSAHTCRNLCGPVQTSKHPPWEVDKMLKSWEIVDCGLSFPPPYLKPVNWKRAAGEVLHTFTSSSTSSSTSCVAPPLSQLAILWCL